MVLYEKRLEEVIGGLRENNLPGLSLFLTAGYPTLNKFMEILRFINKEKLADFIEIGIPFSDPVADGIVIQNSSAIAIKRGATLKKIIDKIAADREKLNIPMVLMTYLNPVYAGGLEKNFKIAREAGFSAIIIPDLPVDESGDYLKISKKTGLDIVFLASPSTPMKRLTEISGKSFPFLYYVSRFGITGVRKKLSADISSKIKAVKRHSKVPVYCGFGISSPAQAAVVGREADGVIIGSAVTRLIYGNKSDYFKEIKKFAINIKKELKMCVKK